METNKKIIGNALSAYFMVFVSGLFLFNKKNPLVHNDFVKSHTKTALLIHTLFFIIILFAYFGIGSSIDILGFSINRIIVTTLFLGVFAMMLYAVYEAHKGEVFTISDLLHLTSQEKLLELKHKKNLNEQEKLGLILAGIPLIGFYLSATMGSDPDFKKRVHSNLIISLCITFCIIVKVPNFALLLLLSYIIFIVFSSIALLIKEEIVNLNLDAIPSFEKLELLFVSFFHYLSRYFGKREFQEFHIIYKQVETQRNTVDSQNILGETHFPFFLLYIPVVGILFTKALNTRYVHHYKNSLGITTTLILGFTLLGFESWIPYLVIFPLSFALGNKENLTYKTPLCYDLGELICKTLFWILHLGKSVRKIQQTEEVTSIQVQEKIIDTVLEKIQ